MTALSPALAAVVHTPPSPTATTGGAGGRATGADDFGTALQAEVVSRGRRERAPAAVAYATATHARPGNSRPAGLHGSAGSAKAMASGSPEAQATQASAADGPTADKPAGGVNAGPDAAPQAEATSDVTVTIAAIVPVRTPPPIPPPATGVIGTGDPVAETSTSDVAQTAALPAPTTGSTPPELLAADPQLGLGFGAPSGSETGADDLGSIGVGSANVGSDPAGGATPPRPESVGAPPAPAQEATNAARPDSTASTAGTATASSGAPAPNGTPTSGGTPTSAGTPTSGGTPAPTQAAQPAAAAVSGPAAGTPIRPDAGPTGGGADSAGTGAGNSNGTLDPSALPGAPNDDARPDGSLGLLSDRVATAGAIGLATQVAVAADAAIASTAAALGGPAGATTLTGLGAPAVQAPTLSPSSQAAMPSNVAELTRLARISADGSARLTVRLDPPELGPVTMHLTSRGSDVQLTLRADTPAGAAALAGQQARVRELLAAQGFDLARFTISGSDSSSLSDPGRQRDNSPEGRQGDQRTNDARNGDFSSGREQGDRARAGLDGEGFGGSRSGSHPGSRSADGSGVDPSLRRTAPPAAQEGTWL